MLGNRLVTFLFAQYLATETGRVWTPKMKSANYAFDTLFREGAT